MQKAAKLFYRLTGRVPRKMPQTKEELNKLKEIFVQAFGLKDCSQVWYTIYSNMAAVKGSSVRISYSSLANIAKRLDINKLLQDQKLVEYQAHMDILKEKAEKVIGEEKSEELITGEPIDPTVRVGASDL